MTKDNANFIRECLKRIAHYLRLGFTDDEIVDNNLALNDELWEKVKDSTIDPNNEYDRVCKASAEKVKEFKHGELGREDLKEEFRKTFRAILKK